MQILLPDTIAQKIKTALKRSGQQEIGGILMGEHVDKNIFRVKDITIQRQGGTFTSFIRTVEEIINPLKQFFQKTNYQFTRFNYLGEWHSHPSFSPEPSHQDQQAMLNIVEDPTVGAHFVALMIFRLNIKDQLEGTATIFLPSKKVLKAVWVIEHSL